MKMNRIHTTFESFLNEAYNSNEEFEFVVEAFKSSKLSALMDLKGASYDNKSMQKIIAALYRTTKIKLDEITDDMLEEMTPAQAYKSKAPGFYFYISDNEKENPYYNGESYRIIPGNRLLAVANGANEIYNLEWASRWSADKGQYLKNSGRYGGDDTVGIDKKHSGYGSSGLSNIKRISEVSDRVLYLNLELVPSSQTQIRDRAAARVGATALMDPKDFKKQNLARYEQIKNERLLASADSIDKEVEKVLNQANEMVMKAVTTKEFDQYGYLVIAKDPRGRNVTPGDISNYTSRVLDYYSKLIQAQNEVERVKDKDKWESDYANKRVKETTLTLKQHLQLWDAKSPKIAW